jgi:PAS domain S-box-containing protein
MLRRWVENNFHLTDYELVLKSNEGNCLAYTVGIYSSFEGSLLKSFWLVQREISLLRQTVDELRRAEQHHRNLLERPGLVMVRVRPDGKYLYISPHISDIVGYTPADFERNPQLFVTLLHPEDVARHEVIYEARRQRSTKIIEVEFRVRRKDGTYHWFFERQTPKLLENGEVEYYDSLAFDIQDRKQLETELIHAQRMDIVGSLAHGIAHDFNNHLTAILGQLGLVLSTMPPEGRSFSQIAAAEKAALCCAEMTRHLLSFGRKESTRYQPINVQQMAEETSSLLKHLLPATIAVELRIDAAPLSVLGDFAQVQQVIMNLAVNSRDAMPHGGKLTITASDLLIDAQLPATKFLAAPQGRYVQFSVADTGSGIDAALLPRIFEPFFTTKPRGRGTGLGLSMVYSIVQAHSGTVHVQSERGRGTTISFILPACAEPVPNRIAVGPKALPGGNEVVLVADDDELVRGMVGTALEMHGYEVIQAVNGEDALTKFLLNRSRVRLAIIDQTMPKLSGREVVNRCRQEVPELPIMLASGHPASVSVGTDSEIFFLRKPFSIQELLLTVRAMIDRRPTALKIAG